MDSILWETLKQAPGFAALVFVVYIFLKQMSQASAERGRALDRLHLNSREDLERSLTAIERNTEVLSGVKTVLERINGGVKL